MTKTDIINIYKWENITDYEGKMVEKKILLGVLFLIMLMTILGFVHAAHTAVITPLTINQSQIRLFNITLNNSNEGQMGNITIVNISLPSGLIFVDSSTNGTNTIGEFTNNSRDLIWTNTTDFLINGSVNNSHFWFNLTTTNNSLAPGVYTIAVTSTNTSGTWTFGTSVSVTVVDVTAPLMTFVAPIDDVSLSQNYIVINITATDNSAVGTIVLRLYNSTYTNTTSSTGTNHYVNISNLGEGVYYYNATVNDSKNNVNDSVATRSFRLDTTKPVIYLISPDDGDTYTADNNIDFEYNVTDAGSIKNCSLFIDSDVNESDTSVTVNITQGITSSALEDSVYDWTIGCYDFAGNYNESEEEWTVELDYISDDDSSSGGGDYTPSFWTKTYSPTDEQATAGYNKELKKGERIKVKVGNESHYVGVIKVSSDEVTINVSSNPQQAVLDAGETKSFEVTNDSYYDINVTLNEINSTNANISVQSVHEKMSAVAILALTEGQQEEEAAAEADTENETSVTEAVEQKAVSLVKNKWFWIILVIALVVIGGALYYFLVVKKSKIARSVKIRES